ncbi:MAG: o-succinylbenzoate synthase [Bacteroidetes bacterium]|jgi:o-succinylbenzoate synthase|nr:o-succinylbenzoate synthase [Bacteroidota bacterium]
MESFTAEFVKHNLVFKQPANTSRATLTHKNTYYLLLRSDREPDLMGVGECSFIEGLSIDNAADFESQLALLCTKINEAGSADVDFDFDAYPSIEFGLEMAIMDLENGGKRCYFEENEFFHGERDIAINGLVWMGSVAEMTEQIDDLLAQDYKVVKLKIGSLDFVEELALIKYIRSKHSPAEIEIRLDANGAYRADEALLRLHELAEYGIHSIEQPIATGQWDAMAKLVAESPIDIALDEELIGIQDPEQKELMLSTIRPQYIIIKPSLLGGFGLSEEWMELADKYHIGYWVTSALESNIGLNAIAQWVSDMDLTRPQGLGTGKLYKNNIKSPLVLEQGFLKYDHDRDWDLSVLDI